MMIGNFYMIKMLVQKGASMEALNDYEQTPAYFASNSLLHELGYANFITDISKKVEGPLFENKYDVPEPLVKDLENYEKERKEREIRR